MLLWQKFACNGWSCSTQQPLSTWHHSFNPMKAALTEQYIIAATTEMVTFPIRGRKGAPGTVICPSRAEMNQPRVVAADAVTAI